MAAMEEHCKVLVKMYHKEEHSKFGTVFYMVHTLTPRNPAMQRRLGQITEGMTLSVFAFSECQD